MSSHTSTQPSPQFSKLADYIDGSHAFQDAIEPLKKKAEIGLVLLIDGQPIWTLKRENDKTVLIEREANLPDVIFKVSEEAFDQLITCPDEINQIGVAILKQVGKGGVKISVPGSLFSLLKNGYLEIIKKGGKSFWSHLSELGITSPTKVISIIKNMKSKN